MFRVILRTLGVMMKSWEMSLLVQLMLYCGDRSNEVRYKIKNI